MSDRVAREHADVIGRLRLLADLILPQDVGRSFVTSLRSRNLESRSALGSYAFARVLPDHALDPIPESFATICRICGWASMPPGHEAVAAENLNHLAAERTRYGGVRHLDPQYALFDLAEWRALPSATPTTEDERCLELVLRTPALLSPDGNATDLERAVRSVVPSNKAERQTLIRILGYSGVLDAPGYSSFFDSYVLPDARRLPHQRFADWGYPVIWWRARDGVRRTAVDFWFGAATSLHAS